MLERNDRVIAASRFKKSKSIRNAARFAGGEYLSPAEQIKVLAPRTSGSDADLVRNAIYSGDPAPYPDECRGYLQFRMEVLQEIAALRAKLHRLALKALDDPKLAKRLRKLPSGERERRVAELRHKIETEGGGLFDMHSKAIKKLLQQGAARESKRATLQPIVDQAAAILDAVNESVVTIPVKTNEAGEVVKNSQLNALLNRILPHSEIASLLQQALREHQRIYPDQVVGRQSVPPTEKTRRGTDTSSEDSALLTRSARERETLSRLISVTDAFEKCVALQWVCETLQDRSGHFRCFLREAYQVRLMAFAYGMKFVYRELRATMTPAERRAFIFMFNTNFKMDGHIPALEPVIYSFLDIATAANQGTFIRAVVLKDSAVTDAELTELREAWRAHLSIYPTLLLLVRDEEQQQAARRRRSKLDGVARRRLADEVRESRRSDPFDQACRLVERNPERLVATVKRLLPPREAEAVLSRLSQEKVAETGKARGVTPQAVSVAYTRGIKKLRTALNEKGSLWTK